MNFLLKYKFLIIGGVLGALGGYAYYAFIGCQNNDCSLTSRPLNATLYGAVLVGLLFSVFLPKKKS